MKTFTLTHEISADPARFWELFFDDAYNEALYTQGLGFPRYELLSIDRGEKAITRSVRVTPKLDLPGPIAKVLGGGFAYVEDGTFDRASQTYRWHNVPADKLSSEGTIRAEPAGPGRIRRVTDFRIEGKMFGLGGLLESTLEKNLRAGWDKSQVFMNDWIARRG